MTAPVTFILGMHNSGTSLLARLAALLGLELGPEVLTRDSFEAKPAYDYWEHAGIVELQDEALHLLNRHWSTPQSHLPIPQDAWDGPEITRIAGALGAILDRELAAAAGRPWGFKDPRTVRLLPLWRRLLARRGLAARYLISLRDPAIVTASFADKGRVTPADAEALWRRSYLEALSYSEGAPRLVVDYDAWLDQPERQAAALAAFLGQPQAADDALAAVRDAIDPSLRRTRASQLRLAPFTVATAECLRAMIGGREPTARIAALLDRAAATDRRSAA
ncbi:hypothetical protein [Oceanibaculum sp.]|uniref:hypothetical protein n=1 Tax=Oceanibaculum sp. TaxID=1903597 RepID=UPI00258A9418|nr:hypothetical protein [Oceanibaculum sp.]MCH2395308.1 hypothetical protein [Oceanibaculum sp.]